MVQRKIMMNYEIFKEVVAEKFLDYMPKECKGMKVMVQPVTKINQKLDGLSIYYDGPGHVVSLTIYINDMYESYKETDNLDIELKEAARKMYKALQSPTPDIPTPDASNAKDNIIFQLVNTDMNKDLLSCVPNRQFGDLDLSIVYRWLFPIDNGTFASKIVKNSHAKELGFSENELYKLAFKNTKILMTPELKSMSEVMQDIFIADVLPAELADMMIEPLPLDQSTYILTNTEKIYGVISLVYDELLAELAEKIGSNLYVLPVSIHEAVIVSADLAKPEYLAEQLSMTNEELELDERLSNNVYLYERNTHKLSICNL